MVSATEEEVLERAAQWDQPASEYIQLAERYLGFQQPGSIYGFADAGDGCKRVEFVLFTSRNLQFFLLEKFTPQK